MSFGQLFPYELGDVWAVTTAGLNSAGIAVIAAAGNDGADGMFATSAPSSDPSVIAVGSVENTQFPLVYSAIDSLGLSFQYASIWPRDTSGRGRDVYVLGGDGTGCDEASWLAASNAISKPTQTTIIFTDTAEQSCSSADKEAFWVKYDFVFIMRYFSGPSDVLPENQQYEIPPQTDATMIFASLSITDGPAVVANYKKAGGYAAKYRFSFTDQESHSTPNQNGGYMSWYSSMGPTWDTLEMKPQLSGPGGQILSTWPLGFNAGYAIISGTSMATPFVAGCYALIKSQFPKLSVQAIRELMQGTAVPLHDDHTTTLLASVAQQGSGLVCLL